MEWPLHGTILIDYSMDQTTYFPTLDQYKLNPSIVVQAGEGAPVVSELLARVRALLRRISIEDGNNKEHQTTVNYKDLTIEKENRVVRRGDEVINLTKREYELLLILMENINVVMSRKDLLSKVWGYDSKVETNVVDVYIRYLRNKIDRPGEKSYIQTVRGTGYVIRS